MNSFSFFYIFLKIISSLPGPTPIEVIGHPTNSSSNSMYARALAGNSEYFRMALILVFQPGTILKVGYDVIKQLKTKILKKRALIY